MLDVQQIFNKEDMMKDEYGFYLRQMAREIPMTIDRVDKLVTFVANYIHTRNRVIKKYEANGKNTEDLVADRDYALYILGLGERPVKQAKVILQNDDYKGGEQDEY